MAQNSCEVMNSIIFHHLCQFPSGIILSFYHLCHTGSQIHETEIGVLIKTLLLPFKWHKFLMSQCEVMNTNGNPELFSEFVLFQQYNCLYFEIKS